MDDEQVQIPEMDADPLKSAQDTSAYGMVNQPCIFKTTRERTAKIVAD